MTDCRCHPAYHELGVHAPLGERRPKPLAARLRADQLSTLPGLALGVLGGLMMWAAHRLLEAADDQHDVPLLGDDQDSA